MAETTTTTGTAPAAGGEGRPPADQSAAHNAHRRAAHGLPEVLGLPLRRQGGTGPRLRRGHQEGRRPCPQGG
ncbi:MAG: hypothetical protein ACLSHO_11320 [Dysosmobacter sp.]